MGGFWGVFEGFVGWRWDGWFLGDGERGRLGWRVLKNRWIGG